MPRTWNLRQRLDCGLSPIDPVTGCQYWTRNGNRFRRPNGGGFVRPDVAELELKRGRPLAAGEVVAHTCGDRKCIHPDHLAAANGYRPAEHKLEAVRVRVVAGMSYSAIAEELNYSEVTVSKWARRYMADELSAHLVVYSRRFDEVKRLRLQGLTHKAIAAQLGVHRATVTGWLRWELKDDLELIAYRQEQQLCQNY